MPPARGELDALGGAFAPPECREHNMMTPMLFQYVVGLCCLRRDPEAVDVIIGDSVADAAAGIQRDVDVTITLREADGSLWAFKGYEVKRESQPLDVTIVEQLCMKFNDMPSVTHRAIVSASGYTKAAIAKAKTHKVHLYERADWTQPVSEIIPELERMGLPQHAFRFRTVTLYWRKPAAFLSVSEGPASFRWERSTPASDDHGNRHPQFENIGAYVDFVEGASSQILWTFDHIQRHVTPELRAAADHSDVVETGAHPHARGGQERRFHVPARGIEENRSRNNQRKSLLANSHARARVLCFTRGRERRDIHRCGNRAGHTGRPIHSASVCSGVAAISVPADHTRGTSQERHQEAFTVACVTMRQKDLPRRDPLRSGPLAAAR